MKQEMDHDDLPEEQPAQPPTELGHRIARMRVILQDICYLMDRVEKNTLASIGEHVELQEEIHEAHRILASFDGYVTHKMVRLEIQHEILRRYSSPPLV